MTVPFAQRIATSALELSKQAFSGSEKLNGDLEQLQPTGKAPFLDRGARHRPSSDFAGSSSQRSRRALYKGDDDQIRSIRKEPHYDIGIDLGNDGFATTSTEVPANSLDLSFGPVYEQRHRYDSKKYGRVNKYFMGQAQPIENEFRPHVEKTWECLYPGQPLEKLPVDGNHKNLDMMIEEYARFADTWKLFLSPQSDYGFTYTWDRSMPTLPNHDTDSASKREQLQSQPSADTVRSKAAARAEQISAHFLKTQHDRQVTKLFEPSLEECSFLRQSTEQRAREERAIRQADMARLHGTQNFSHHVPLRTSGLRKQAPQLETVDTQLRDQTKVEHVAPASLKHEQEEEVSKSVFQCPFPHCHHALKTGAYWVRKWDDSSDLNTLELARSGSQGLMCVHDGCLECFVDGSEWREHIMSPHHENGSDRSRSLTERMMRVWGKRRAVV